MGDTLSHDSYEREGGEGIVAPPGANPSADAGTHIPRSPDAEEISSATPTELLPDVPDDPWEATVQQSFAAELRISRALRAGRHPRRRDLRQLLHDYSLSQISDEVVSHVRRTAKEVTGGNCAYADDDVSLLAGLARRAIDAGLLDGLDGRTRQNLERAKAERVAARDMGSRAPHSADDAPGLPPNQDPPA